jgi:hypothetical protein
MCGGLPACLQLARDISSELGKGASVFPGASMGSGIPVAEVMRRHVKNRAGMEVGI